jgi:hypothetical protein
VPEDLVDEAECRWAPTDDPIFSLLPPNLQQHVSEVYVQIGSPDVSFNSFWNVYLHLQDAVDSSPLSHDIALELRSQEFVHEGGENQGLLLIELQPCEFGLNGIPPLQGKGQYGAALFITDTIL